MSYFLDISGYQFSQLLDIKLFLKLADSLLLFCMFLRNKVEYLCNIFMICEFYLVILALLFNISFS